MITIILPYYENGRMFERHLDEWSSYSKTLQERFSAVIIDDGSRKDEALKHYRSDLAMQVQIWRIKQNIPWNVPGARNLGMRVALTTWCLLTDIDHLLCAADAESLMSVISVLPPQFEPSMYFTFQRRWADGRALNPHPNSYLLSQKLYWMIGGTDEDWSGWWGAGEQVFRKGIQAVAKEHPLKNIFLTHFGRDDISDASTREWGRRDSQYDWRNNPELLQKAKSAPYRPENPFRFEFERVA